MDDKNIDKLIGENARLQEINNLSDRIIKNNQEEIENLKTQNKQLRQIAYDLTTLMLKQVK